MSLWDLLPRPVRIAVVVAAILWFVALPLSVLLQ